MRQSGAALVLTGWGLAVLGAPGCSEERPVARPVAEPPAAVRERPALECRFEPVSLPGEPAESGFEQCFTPAESGGPEWVAASSVERPEAPAAPCPPEMVLVEGLYCPDVRHRCLRYLDEKGARHAKHRCAEFDRNPTCAREREHRRFCIDRDEFAGEAGELPLIDQSWTGARELCKSLGKRLCFDTEWELACEGEAMLPYPYGFVRDAARCNHDRSDLSHRGKLRDLRVRADDRPECTSPYGVRHMVGNVDEWTQRDGFVRPWRSSLRGGWWLAGRNNCRAATTGHDEYYFGPQTGFRCCANPR
jgi:formylglycine-generating enzyme